MKKAELVKNVETIISLALDQEISLAGLTIKELNQVGKWAATGIFEASDNDCRVGYAPKALRRLLPADHYLHTWRKPKRKADAARV